MVPQGDRPFEGAVQYSTNDCNATTSSFNTATYYRTAEPFRFTHNSHPWQNLMVIVSSTDWLNSLEPRTHITCTVQYSTLLVFACDMCCIITTIGEPTESRFLILTIICPRYQRFSWRVERFFLLDRASSLPVGDCDDEWMNSKWTNIKRRINQAKSVMWDTIWTTAIMQYCTFIVLCVLYLYS